MKFNIIFITFLLFNSQTAFAIFDTNYIQSDIDKFTKIYPHSKMKLSKWLEEKEDYTLEIELKEGYSLSNHPLNGKGTLAIKVANFWKKFNAFSKSNNLKKNLHNVIMDLPDDEVIYILFVLVPNLSNGIILSGYLSLVLFSEEEKGNLYTTFFVEYEEEIFIKEPKETRREREAKEILITSLKNGTSHKLEIDIINPSGEVKTTNFNYTIIKNLFIYLDAIDNLIYSVELRKKESKEDFKGF